MNTRLPGKDSNPTPAAHGPEPCASTNSATARYVLRGRGCSTAPSSAIANRAARPNELSRSRVVFPAYERFGNPAGGTMTIRLHRGDLPDLSRYRRARWRSTPRRWGSTPVATGCAWCSSRRGDGSADMVQIPPDHQRRRRTSRSSSPTPAVTKIFHYARFDIAVLKHRFGVVTGPVYCTKIASQAGAAPIPTGTASRTSPANCSTSTSTSSSRARTGRRDAERRSPGPAASDVIYLTPQGQSSTPAPTPRGAPGGAGRCLFGFRPGASSTSPAGRRRHLRPLRVLRTGGDSSASR